jgi:hypothetical protein
MKIASSTAGRVHFKITVKTVEGVGNPNGQLRILWKKSKKDGKVTNLIQPTDEFLDESATIGQRCSDFQ